MASTPAPKAIIEGSCAVNGNATLNLPPCGFLVKTGKKGNIPVSIEKRPKGKKATIISNVQGSAPSLLSALSSLLGSGGTVRQEASGYHWTVELQGDQSERITSALVQLGCVQGLRKPVEDREKKKTTEVVSRICAYDKFLRKGDDRSKSRARAEAHTSETCLPDADCRKWHGAWFYCRGRCTQSVMSDVWEEALDEQDGNRDCSLSKSAPKPAPSSEAELNIILRDLGLLPVVGGAHRIQRLARNPASVGLSLSNYRKAAIAPGARLITDDANPKTASSRGASKVRASHSHPARDEGPSIERSKSRPSKPARPIASDKVGTYSCPLCHCVFGLQKTWKLHMETVHGGMSISMKAATPKVPSVPKSAETQRNVPGLSLTKPKVPTTLQLPNKYSAKAVPLSKKESKVETLTAKGSSDSRVPVQQKHETSSKHSLRGETGSPGQSNRSFEEVVEINVESDSCEKARSAFEGSIIVGETYKVVQKFEPTEDGSEVQLRVKVGDQVTVRWVPEDMSEAYWVYVSALSGNAERQEQWGYVPMHLLVQIDKQMCPKVTPKVALKTPEVHLLTNSSADNKDVPAEYLETLSLLDLSEMRSALFWSKFNSLRLHESLEAAWCSALDGIFEEPSPRSDSGVQPKLEISPSGALEVPQAESDMHTHVNDFPVLQHIGPDRFDTRKRANRWAASPKQASESQVSIAEPCPICGVAFGTSFIEAHIEKCFSKLAHVSTPSVVDHCNDPTMNMETQTWARKKLKDLADRFCMSSRLDIDVALASLIACQSANEMRNEAVSLIFDNQPVKNFAGELWRKKTASQH